MSEAKFVVGQWVTWGARPYRVEHFDANDGTALCNSGAEGSEPIWIHATQLEPFRWEVGKTYRTTLYSVTATINNETTAERVVAWLSNGAHLSFSSVDGELMPVHKKNGWPTHLLPYLAEETPPVADIGPQSAAPSSVHRVEGQSREARKLLIDDACANAESATEFSEFETDEIADVNSPSHYTSHPSGVECIAITEAFNFNVGNAVKYLWRAGLKGDALQDLRKAAWYVQREIERRERAGRNDTQK